MSDRRVGDYLFDETTTFVTDPVTGAKKGSKVCRFDLIPPEALAELSAVYGIGAKKYAERNFEAGYDFGLSFAAMQRHAWRWMTGEDFDPQTGVHHMAMVAWHSFALLTFASRGVGNDNRPTGIQVSAETCPDPSCPCVEPVK